MTTSKRYRQTSFVPGQVASVSTSSQADIPVSRSATPGSAEARQMTVTSGHGLLPWLQTSGPLGACLKTLLVTSRWDSTACWLTWRRKATPAGRSLFRLQASAPRIAATASGSSPEMWWTPTASIGTSDFTLTPNMGNREKRGAGHGGNLLNQMAQRMWPTPTTQDTANNGGPSQHRRNNLPLNAAVQNPDAPQKLSAAWVTRLMGYPDGWLDLESPTHGQATGNEV